MTRLEKAFELFDSYNRNDPNKVVWEGVEYAAEYFYALQLYNWVKKLEPNASETLLLASRSQHIGRWKIPREQYPAGKAAYYKWRTDLSKFHAEIAGGLMWEAGYSPEEVELVQRIIRKEHIRTDPEVQTMENALCLVFLQFQYDDFLQKHDEEKMIRIIQRSWAKMSQPGKDAALTLAYRDKGKYLVEKALGK